jgi:RNA 2',3'-cyclic 3'-phosphodiesterase
LNETIRLFTGIALPDSIRHELCSMLPVWQNRFAFGKWAHPHDWHVTLHFLGEMPVGQKSGVQEALDQAAAAVSAFTLRIAGLGTFGAPRSPSILWIGLPEPLDPLRRLHTELGRTLQSRVGFQAEQRPYRPHLTIARKYRGSESWDPASLTEDEAAVPELSFTVSEACLFVSRLGRSPMYEIVHRSPLRP